jgi:putative transposase
MEALYKEMDISRQAIWKHQQKIAINSIKEKTILAYVKEWRKKHPGMGARPLFYSIKNDGIQLKIGINRFEELLRKNNLNVGIKKTKKPFTSDGKGKDKYENLTNGLILNDINQLIVGDITYFGIGGTFYYIFTLKDVYSQRILELIPSEDMKAISALKCIETAAKMKDLKGVSILQIMGLNIMLLFTLKNLMH